MPTAEHAFLLEVFMSGDQLVFADTLLQPCSVRVSAYQQRTSHVDEAGVRRYQRIAP
jgi:hypothetical protein